MKQNIFMIYIRWQSTIKPKLKLFLIKKNRNLLDYGRANSYGLLAAYKKRRNQYWWVYYIDITNVCQTKFAILQNIELYKKVEEGCIFRTKSETRDQHDVMGVLILAASGMTYRPLKELESMVAAGAAELIGENCQYKYFREVVKWMGISKKFLAGKGRNFKFLHGKNYSQKTSFTYRKW